MSFDRPLPARRTVDPGTDGGRVDPPAGGRGLRRGWPRVDRGRRDRCGRCRHDDRRGPRPHRPPRSTSICSSTIARSPTRPERPPGLERLAPLFAELGAQPPVALRTIYRSFADDPDMLAMLLGSRPAGGQLPLRPAIRQRHCGAAGARHLFAGEPPPALAEAAAIEAAGIDAIVAQGIEAGGHRGVFDPGAHDDALGTIALTRLLVRRAGLPVIAAGGIMDGAGIAAALDLGAAAAQLGTAFVACTESAADDAYRAALTGPGAYHTNADAPHFRAAGRGPWRTGSRRCRISPMTACLPTIRSLMMPARRSTPPQRRAVSMASGRNGPDRSAPLARAMPAADLVRTLREELARCRSAGFRLPPA